MRCKLLTALVFICSSIQAQQINPVPDYVFANRMSVGRSAVTDTLAYFSIGPRYGAIRGFMPPMVVDTALVTGGTKRNGLTIFSIQKNKYLYWDSVRVQWSDFAGSSGAYIFATDTASMLSPYIRAAGNGLTKSGQSLLVDTASIATRARVQKAVDSINANVALKVNISDTASMLNQYLRRTTGSGTGNYVPKFLTYGGARLVGNSLFYSASDNVGIGTANPTEFVHAQTNSYATTFLGEVTHLTSAYIGMKNTGGSGYIASNNNDIFFGTSGSATERMRVTSAGEIWIGSSIDQGAYALQVAGSIYNTTGAVFAANSGNVAIGATSSSYKLDVTGDIRATTTITSGAPTSGSAKPWRLGEAATVSPTSPNRTIRVEIDGTVYYLHAKTTND